MFTTRLLTSLLVFLVLITTPRLQFAQGTKKQEPASDRLIAEPERQAKMAKAVGDLLAAFGIQAGKSISVLDTLGHKEVRVRWQSSASRKANAISEQGRAGSISFGEMVEHEDFLPQHRSFELSTSQMLVIALDATGEMRWFNLFPDPRLIRSESTTPTGEMKSEEFYTDSLEFSIAYPNDATIKELRLYKPAWTGSAYRLDFLAAVEVEPNR